MGTTGGWGLPLPSLQHHLLWGYCKQNDPPSIQYARKHQKHIASTRTRHLHVFKSYRCSSFRYAHLPETKPVPVYNFERWSWCRRINCERGCTSLDQTSESWNAMAYSVGWQRTSKKTPSSVLAILHVLLTTNVLPGYGLTQVLVHLVGDLMWEWLHSLLLTNKVNYEGLQSQESCTVLFQTRTLQSTWLVKSKSY